MRIAPFVLLACLIPAAQAFADAIGDRPCAEAEVAGRITHQDYETLPSPAGSISTGVLLLIDFDVRRVRFGPIRKGPLHIKAISPEWFNESHEIAFYLRREDKNWWIADCRVP